jgi:hypothetical protein
VESQRSPPQALIRELPRCPPSSSHGAAPQGGILRRRHPATATEQRKDAQHKRAPLAQGAQQIVRLCTSLTYGKPWPRRCATGGMPMLCWSPRPAIAPAHTRNKRVACAGVVRHVSIAAKQSNTQQQHLPSTRARLCAPFPRCSGSSPPGSRGAIAGGTMDHCRLHTQQPESY